MVLHDQHVHSEFSADSKASYKEYYEIAKKMGCSYFVTTEHIDHDVVMTQNDWIPDYEKMLELIKTIDQNNGPKILLGAELGFRRDYLDEMYKWENKYDWDVLNLSMHGIHGVEFYYVPFFNEVGVDKALDIYYDGMLDAVKTMNDYTTLSHIDYGVKTALQINPNIKMSDHEEQIIEIMKVIIDKKKALEVNTKVQSAFSDDSHLRYFLNLYKKLGGVRVTLSSDAHNIERYKADYDKYVKVIKECGFDYLCYFIKRKEYHFDI